jgi:hypothetical protein
MTDRLFRLSFSARPPVSPLFFLSSSHLSFCEEKGLNEHVEIMKKGALLAQNPHDYDNIHELTAEDREAIDYEHAHKWSHPATLYLTIFLCALGAATQGWDQTGSNGASEFSRLFIW